MPPTATDISTTLGPQPLDESGERVRVLWRGNARDRHDHMLDADVGETPDPEFLIVAARSSSSSGYSCSSERPFPSKKRRYVDPVRPSTSPISVRCRRAIGIAGPDVPDHTSPPNATKVRKLLFPDLLVGGGGRI